MTLMVIGREQLARELGLTAEDGAFMRRGVAGLLRQPLSRWGLSPRRAVLRFAREQLDAAGLIELFPAPEVGKVLDQLQAMGECQEVSVGRERYVVPSVPRWIPTGDKTGVLLSVGPVPDGLALLEPTSPDDVVRRIRAANEDDLAVLHFAGFRRCSMEEWLRPLHYLRHGSRRLGRLVRQDTLPLDAFWELLVQSLTQDGHLLGEDAEVRVLSGSPGSFFGPHDGVDCEGRWSAAAGDEVWCGYRRGYGDAHWHPVIVSIDGRERRCLDVYDGDEWRWALIARGRAKGASERVKQEGVKVKLSFPAPTQLQTAMDLLGSRDGAWSWSVSQGAPEFWSHVL